MNTQSQKEPSILSQFAKYVSSNVLGMMAFSCYILADTFFIARGIGADALAALNLALPAYSLMNGIGQMIGVGGASRYSLSAVHADSEVHRSSFTRSLVLAVAGAIIFTCIGLLFSEQTAHLLGADETTLGYASTYLRILLSFSPLFFGNSLLSGFVRNDGAPRLAMAGMLTGSLSNIVLDYFFIYTLDLGMRGAALATAAAPGIGILTLSLHFLKKQNKFYIIRTTLPFSSFRDICSLGSSTLVTELSSGIVILIFNYLILGLNGSRGVAAYGILANIALVLVSIFTGIAQGVQPLVSQAKEERLRRSILRYALITSLVLSGISYLLVASNAVPIAELFNKEHDPALTSIASGGMRIYFVSLFFTGINMITTSYLSAADLPSRAFVISILRGFLLVIPAAWILSVCFGLTGVWMSVPVTEGVVAVLSLAFLTKISYRER